MNQQALLLGNNEISSNNKAKNLDHPHHHQLLNLWRRWAASRLPFYAQPCRVLLAWMSIEITISLSCPPLCSDGQGQMVLFYVYRGTTTPCAKVFGPEKQLSSLSILFFYSFCSQVFKGWSTLRPRFFTWCALFGMMTGLELKMLRFQPGVLPVSYTHP